MQVPMKELQPSVKEYEYFYHKFHNDQNYKRITLKHSTDFWKLEINYKNGLTKKLESRNQHLILARLEQEDEIQLDILDY